MVTFVITHVNNCNFCRRDVRLSSNILNINHSLFSYFKVNKNILSYATTQNQCPSIILKLHNTNSSFWPFSKKYIVM